jgi:c-di-AMP phosphodiesterase-like protein
MLFYQPIISFIMALFIGYMVYYSFKLIEDTNLLFKRAIEELSNTFDSATKHAIFNMPFPMIFVDESGKVTWYNTPFLNLSQEEDLLNRPLTDLVPLFNINLLKSAKENEPIDIEFKNRYYKVFPNFLENKRQNDKENLTILYWVDNTDFIELSRAYRNERPIIILAFIDNYDDIKSSTPDTHRPILMAEIDRMVNEYFNQHNALVRKYESDKYLIIINQVDFEKIKQSRFALLDQLRELKMGNAIPITLSIGASQKQEGLLDSYKDARASIDVALGRGGDQAVVNTGSGFEFFGGKSKAVEKRNKVKARVMADALKQLITQSDKVFIMSHKNPDMDALGSAFGTLRAVVENKKEGYIIFNEENPSIKNMISLMQTESPELMEKLISTQKALDMIGENDLLINVDNHKPSLAESKEMIDSLSKIVVIDHHRRGAEFMDDSVLIYIEPYASSASELVTEIISYMGYEDKITKFEAEALLAGITLDTKNFTFQTGVRTFEAASILKRAGADTLVVKQLFRDDFNTFINKAEVIRSAKLVHDSIAIGRLEKTMDDSILIAAQAANELLNINNVEASFVLSKLKDSIHISGRSLGDISVQLILEKLGGGGHLTSAGTQLHNVSIEEAERILIETIDKYLQEGDEK